MDHSGASRGAGFAAAAIAMIVVAAVQYLVEGAAAAPIALAVSTIAVLAVAWLGGLTPALLVTVAGAFVTYARSGSTASRIDLVAPLLVAVIGLLVSLAIARARASVGQARVAQRAIERQLDRIDRLHQLAGTLLQGRTPADVIESCLPELVHAVRASAGALFFVSEDGNEYQLVRALGYDAREPGSVDRFPLVPGSPVADTILGRAMLVVERPARPSQDGTGDSSHPAVDVRKGDVIVPIVAGTRAGGAFVLRFRPPRALDDGEREFLLRAGRHTGHALDRARSYEAAGRGRADAEALRIRADSELRERQKAEEALRFSEARNRALAARTSRLYALSAGLSEAVSLNAVATAVVRHGKTVAGASAASVDMLVEGGAQLETLAAEGHGSVEAHRRTAVRKGLCTTAAVETQRPIFVGSFAEWQENYPESASIAADGGYVSSAALPLLAEGTVLGVLSFYFTLPVNFDEEYRALLTSVAHHCAQAIDRARLYETAERARAEAEAANRSKDDFLSIISHELRTPLNAILGWAAMLRSGSVDDNRKQRAIEAIFNNATRQGQLIEELLDVSRIVAGRASFDRQEIDLVENVRGAVEAMMPLAAARGVEIRLRAPAGIYVSADPRRLEQVFLNLLSNAVKFSAHGGHIAVDVTSAEGLAEVRVADHGSGIDPAFLPHVFERFRQADSAPTRSAGGLGLGLFISRQLIEAQGGAIRAESAGVGKGATFTVALPAAGGSTGSPRLPPAASANPAPVPNDRLPELNGISVLIVDDEADAREVMASALEACGAKVLLAASAREALDILARADVDLVLSDIAMPGQDGIELIREIRGMSPARLSGIPAAAVTAHAREDQRDRALAAGFDMHLTKPVHPLELAGAVASLVSRQGCR